MTIYVMNQSAIILMKKKMLKRNALYRLLLDILLAQLNIPGSINLVDKLNNLTPSFLTGVQAFRSIQ